MSQTTDTRPAFIPTLLENMTLEDFSSLKNGSYLIYMTTPNGNPAEIRILIRNAKPNLREVCFDLHTDRCNWDLKPGVTDAFRDAIFAHLKAAGVKSSFWGGGKSQITFNILKGEEADWMHRAAQLITNPENLVHLTFP